MQLIPMVSPLIRISHDSETELEPPTSSITQSSNARIFPSKYRDKTMFGLEVSGPDAHTLLREVIHGSIQATKRIRRMIHVHGVIGFRSHGLRLTDEDMVQLGARFGRIKRLSSSPWITVKGHSQNLGTPVGGDIESNSVLHVIREADETCTIFGDEWHRDCGYMDAPPYLSIFHAKEIPPCDVVNVGAGDTIFSCQRTACAMLPPLLRAKLDQCDGRHCLINARLIPQDAPKPKRTNSSGSLRPLIGRHPSGGWDVVDVCGGFLEELLPRGCQKKSTPELEALLVETLEHCTQKVFQWRWRWEAGDVVLMDNIRCLHCATGGYEGHRRELLRVLVRDWSECDCDCSLFVHPVVCWSLFVGRCLSTPLFVGCC